MKRTIGWVFVAVVGPFVLGCAPTDQGSSTVEASPERSLSSHLGGSSNVVAAIEHAASLSDVPAAVLASIAYAETRFRHVATDGSHADHDGHASPRAGMFALTDAELAATSIGASDDLHAHALATAQLLAAIDEGIDAGSGIDRWHAVITQWRSAELADTVMRHLGLGLRGVDVAGNRITVSAFDGLKAFDAAAPLSPFAARQGYPSAIWNPAHSSNFANASRGAADINYIVVHTIQGSYGSAINWFKNPDANVSAHYVVKSTDGEVTQMVDDSDRAWHDACFNSQTVGIEHEGFVTEPELWYTETMYLASARLAAHLARTYNIPVDRDHFFGHGDAPDCSTHTDPGPGWDWNHFMDLVRADGEAELDAAYVSHEWPTEMVAGEEVVVSFDFDNLSNVTWGLDETRLGTAEPLDRESAFFVEGNWLSRSRATGADHSNYGPGMTGRFTFLVKAPEVDEPTTFTESFQLVQEGVEWFGPTATATIRVVPRGWTPPAGGGDEGDNSEDDDTVAGELGGGCSAASGSSGGLGGLACVILFAGAFLSSSRRRRRGSTHTARR